MTESDSQNEQSPQGTFLESTREELERARAELKEIRLLVEQSQGEVDKLAQRNAKITARLHQLHANFDTVPREDIRATYDAAQDAQQRLFTMRGQLDKLKGDEKHLERLTDWMGRALQILERLGGNKVSTAVPLEEKGIQEIIEAQEEERYKISRQIHDGPAQSLSNFILQAEIAMRLMDRDPEKAREELTNLKKTASATFSQMRGFIFDLRPMMLDDLGLVPTLRRYADAFQEKSGIEAKVIITGSDQRLEPHREVIIFRAIQELLNNVRQHAQATQVKVSVDLGETHVRSIVEDNGQGFDYASLGEGEENGRGLRSMEKRLLQVGGSMEVESRPDEGTRVIFTIPRSGGS